MYFIFINSAGDYESSKPSYSLNEVMNNAKTISYDDLFRYNDQYVGTAVQYEGEIIQVGGSSGNYYFRIDVTKNVNSWGTDYEDTVYVTYSGDDRFLEGDIVKFYGVVQGIKSYTSVIGAEIEVPEIHALSIELIEKAGER